MWGMWWSLRWSQHWSGAAGGHWSSLRGQLMLDLDNDQRDQFRCNM